MQFVIAGKAHPQDDAGKALIQQMFASRRARTCGTGSSSWKTTTCG